jgi:uncharacterized protein YtpQ (UPF0354 family)
MGLFDRFRAAPTEDKFARLMADMMRRCGDIRESSYNKADFSLTFTRDGEEAGIINLRNLFIEYCNADKMDRDELLKRTCRGMLNTMDLPEDFEDVKPDLLPTVRNRSMIEVMRLDAQTAGKEPMEMLWAPLTDELVICLVYDLPTSLRFVVPQDLEKWGVTLYEALEVAEQNLAQREFPMMALDDRVYVIETGDAYDGTRLLLKDGLRKLRLNGQLIALPVTRDCLLITGSEDAVGLGIVAQIAKEKFAAARPLLPIPLILNGDDWEKWSPPEDHPCRRAYREFELGYYHGEYAEQKKQLEELDQKTGRDVFEATYSVYDMGGELLSNCAWSKGVVSSLPKTDSVGLFDPATESVKIVRWEQLQEVAGELLEPLDCYPPRLLVSEFPSDEQVSRLETVGPK